jgi:hypothetical protein
LYRGTPRSVIWTRHACRMAVATGPMRARIAAHLDAVLTWLPTEALEGSLLKSIYSASTKFLVDGSGDTRLHGQRLLATLRNRLKPSRLSALLTAYSSPALANRIRAAMYELETGKLGGYPQHIADAARAAIGPARIDTYWLALQAAEQQISEAGLKARAHHATSKQTTGPTARSAAQANNAIATERKADAPQRRAKPTYDHVKSKVAGWISGRGRSKVAPVLAGNLPAPVPVVPFTPAQPSRRPVVPGTKQGAPRFPRQILTAWGNDRRSAVAKKVPGSGHEDMPGAKKKLAQPSKAEKAAAVTASGAASATGAAALQAVDDTRGPTFLWSGTLLPPGTRFASTEVDRKRLHTRTPLRRILSAFSRPATASRVR